MQTKKKVQNRTGMLDRAAHRSDMDRYHSVYAPSVVYVLATETSDKEVWHVRRTGNRERMLVGEIWLIKRGVPNLPKGWYAVYRGQLVRGKPADTRYENPEQIVRDELASWLLYCNGF